MKKEIVASIRIRFDARFLSGARPFLRRGPGEEVFFFFEFFQRTMRMLVALEPRHANCVSGTKMKASAGMEGPLRANLHEWGPFQIGVYDGTPISSAMVLNPSSRSKVTSGLLSFKIRDAVVAWGKSNSSTSCLRSCLSFFFKTPSISCIVA